MKYFKIISFVLSICTFYPMNAWIDGTVNKGTPSENIPKKQVWRNTQPSPQLLQKSFYLAEILTAEYKENSQDIKGFKVRIVNIADGGNKDYLGKIVFLPYIVVIKKHLVTEREIRNSGGTPIENLDIHTDKLIEFDTLSSVTQPTIWGDLFVITKRPTLSAVKPENIK